MNFYQILEISLVFLFPFFIILATTPYLIRKLTKRGLVVKDYYKKGNRMVPTGGGIAIMLAVLFSMSINSIFYNFDAVNYVLLNVILLFGLFGILDDMIDIGRPAKLVLMYYCSYPLMHYVTHSLIVVPFIGNVELGIFYSQLIVPTFVLVTANLVNMHSGFNGMSSGLSVIILVSLIIKSIINGQFDNIVSIFSIIALTGATFGFFLFERYPSRIFWGNVGSLTVGSAIGVLIVMQGFIISGFIMLLPHTINFLMYVYWRARKYPQVKFGKVREDGTLEVPNNLTLKWVLPYYKKVNEKQATYAMYAVTAIFSIIGIIIPG
ncbi:MAG: UDP-N-acetylglucosamine-1-phosphate transferase [Candidatus Methanoperedens nitroreducens]|uniref:UDP-N-acetylglucosamine-1-phosphate transferase n=1 Tax=Candidatus Methanoperedens nitratireducens TaxID=1392998 RepID=A0A0N8KRF5_9EURY|nr:glycosyltransferase 4 family protein [Candidatus Methanoperedens sp. BLZ2]KAB2946142.1 MAG: UDP-N-acetylglucosamine-1-phosphate transferase [Candidatus Methanoperedens sp.]KPQ44794.1 MAG: UDP-N-acetylglucosamine-1-phosphate transferase [Candidatus Methanoperedens sp. BLZ1]MBZ0177217.1 UDP-N-acetylglucosamine-1-phosphate transferase [Candidatus Methanoperedens nitroreducens]CAG0957055.1 UDP-N-acetylglucosamine--dolichyl-phosphate N-acetylglucosaminephosphotransferase [Methanosarcinales archae